MSHTERNRAFTRQLIDNERRYLRQEIDHLREQAARLMEQAFHMERKERALNHQLAELEA